MSRATSPTTTTGEPPRQSSGSRPIKAEEGVAAARITASAPGPRDQLSTAWVVSWPRSRRASTPGAAARSTGEVGGVDAGHVVALGARQAHGQLADETRPDDSHLGARPYLGEAEAL